MTKTDPNIPVPVDAAFFHLLRAEMQSGFGELRTEMAAMRASNQDHRFDTIKHGQQIETLAKDMMRTDKHLELVDGRVVVLEKKAGDESAVNRVVRHGWARKVMDGAAGQIGTVIVLGIAAVVVWIVSQYFKQVSP